MTGTRKRYSAAFKARVAPEAAKQTRTLAELSQGLPGPPGPDQPVEEATPRRRRVALRRPPSPRARPERGPPGRTLPADRSAQHGGRVVGKKVARWRLTSSGPWSNLSILGWASAGNANCWASADRPATSGRPRRRRRPAPDAADRPAVPQDPVLRQPADDGVPGAFGRGGQSQAGPAAHGGHGPGGRASPADAPPSRRRTRGPIPTCSAIGC